MLVRSRNNRPRCVSETTEMLWQLENRQWLAPPHGMHACDAYKHSPILLAYHQGSADRVVSSGQLFLPLADHRLAQSHINLQDTLPERPMSSESLTKPGLDEASAPAQPEKPPPKHIFEGHEDRIWSFVFLHDNVHIVSGSDDGTMRK